MQVTGMMSRPSLRDRVRNSDVWRDQSRTAAPWCQKEPVELVQASEEDASGTPPLGRVHLDEGPRVGPGLGGGGLHIPAGLGTVRS